MSNDNIAILVLAFVVTAIVVVSGLCINALFAKFGLVGATTFIALFFGSIIFYLRKLG